MALPWIFEGVTNQSVVLVVSPLVALMADQVAQCCSCAVARYVMLCQCGCRLRNQTFLGNKSRIGLPRRRGSMRSDQCQKYLFPFVCTLLLFVTVKTKFGCPFHIWMSKPDLDDVKTRFGCPYLIWTSKPDLDVHISFGRQNQIWMSISHLDVKTRFGCPDVRS